MREGKAKIRNMRESVKALKDFDPQAAKDISKRINKAAGGVRDQARAEMPGGSALRNWGRWRVGQRSSSITDERRDLSYKGPQSNIQVKRGGQSRKKGGTWSSLIGVINRSPSGAIFELAGRGNSGSRLAKGLISSGFGVSAKRNTKRPGVFKAFDDNEGQAKKDISEALDDAQKKLQIHLNSMT
jgi:hypothetical protein